MKVSATCILVHSMLRLRKWFDFVCEKRRQLYACTDDLLKLSEIESVLCISAQNSKISKCDKLCTGELGVAAKQRMTIKLRCERKSLNDLSRATKSNKTQRMSKQSSFITSMGRKTKLRTTLEAERRFCGN